MSTDTTLRPIPQDAIDVVSKWEGFRATAYLCPAGVPTIGYGHTRGVRAEDVGRLTITLDQARDFLAADLGGAAAALVIAIGADNVGRLSDKQYAALLSFAFNVGAEPGWVIWATIKARADSDVPTQLMRFVNAGGRRMDGLVARRQDEIDLWRAGSLPVPLPAILEGPWFVMDGIAEPVIVNARNTPIPLSEIVRWRNAMADVQGDPEKRARAARDAQAAG